MEPMYASPRPANRHVLKQLEKTLKTLFLKGPQTGLETQAGATPISTDL